MHSQLQVRNSILAYADCGKFSCGHHSSLSSVPQEQSWRCPAEADRGDAFGSILVSRWVDTRSFCRQEKCVSSSDRHVIGVSLMSTRLKYTKGSRTIFDGVMPAGTLLITGPSQSLTAEFRAPCDFIHFHVLNEYLQSQQRAVQPSLSSPLPNLEDFVIRDPLVELLGRTLIENSNVDDFRYLESVGQMLVMHIARMRSTLRTTPVLQNWRLRRVQEHIDANLDEPLGLSVLASVAGLSRMHFAAQFRAATGCRPHDYVLSRRIEHAKLILSNTDTPLSEIALAVGFQAQSHFSTVFKRFTGETPKHWRRAALGTHRSFGETGAQARL
jgi:AraC family transcriptional regulator